MTNKELVENYCNDAGLEEGVVLFENPSFEGALLGISNDGRAIYSYTKMVQSLIKEEKMSDEEAVEFIDYNTLGAYYSDKQPIVCFDEQFV